MNKGIIAIVFLVIMMALIFGCSQKKQVITKEEIVSDSETANIDKEINDLDSELNQEELDDLDSDLENIDW